MSGKRRPRGGREAKVRLVLDLCRQAHRRQDVVSTKRALETLCMCYDVNPTHLTSQGIRGLKSTQKTESQTTVHEERAPILRGVKPPPTPPATPTEPEPALDQLMSDIESFIEGDKSQ